MAVRVEPEADAPRPESSRPVADPTRSTPKAPPPDEDDDGADDDEEVEDDALVTYSAGEALVAISSVFRFLTPFLARHRRGLALITGGLLVETAFNVVMPISLKYLIDDVLTGEGDRGSTLIVILVSLGVAGILTSLVAVAYEWVDARVSSGIVGDMRDQLFDRTQTLSSAFYARVKRGDVLSRFSVDMAAIEDTVLHLANSGLLPLLELVAGIVLLFVLNWQLALGAMLIFPVTLLGPRFLAPLAVASSYDVKQREAAILSVVSENIGAQTVVKAFGLQTISSGWFRARNDGLRRSMARAKFLTTMVERSITITVLLLHLAIFGVGAYLTYTDAITLGTFVTFESVFWELSYNVAHVTRFVPVVIRGSAATRHMKELLDAPERNVDRPDAAEAPRLAREIAFEGVSFSYDGSEYQLRGLDLVIPAGRRVAIVGPSGAGKSTLLNLILRLYSPTGGRVAIDGVDIAGVTRESLRAQMAVVFQDNILFGTSMRENIRLGRSDASDEDVVRAAKAAEIHKFIRSLPAGYDTVLGERGDTLSGGQRQRIAIARALIRDPAILLLDEATSALDHTTETSINRTLRRLSAGRTVLSITHRLTAVADMDEIIVMKDGRVAERGTHAELLSRDGLYASLWHNQDGDGGDDEG